MKIRKIIILAGIAVALSTTTSCLDLLDKQAETTVTEEQVFGDERRTREFLNNIYSYLPDDFWYIGAHGSFSDVLTDNAINTNTWDLYPSSIRQGAISATNNPEGWYWAHWYAAMRKTNKLIENIHLSPVPNVSRPGDDENLLKDRYVAEARLMRALYHFEAMKRFGKIVIADHSFQTNELNPQRNEISEVVEFIAKECDEVLPLLPFVYKNTSNIGRVNGATALALKSRALLYGASPLFNNKNNQELWKDAAAAAKQLIDLAPSGAIGLMNNFPELFLEQFNTEIILCRNSWSVRIFEADQLPKGVPGSTGFTQPTQNLVDCFEMTDGSKFDWNNPIHAANPYANRDPRFNYTIIFNGSNFVNTTFDFTVNSGAHESLSGYGVRKWVNPDWDPYDVTNRVDRKRAAVIFRYGEVLLNFAEAMNEAYGPDGGPFGEMTARWTVNQLRARATVNMPEYPAGMSVEQFRDRIQNERRVELAFEGHRYFDMRRWKKISDMNQLRGVNIIKDGNNIDYVITVMEARTFDDKFYLYPIPYDELIKASNLGQNPGWGVEDN